MSFLTDINNNDVSGFYIGDDGIVYGQNNGSLTDSLSEESCLLVNMRFDEKCYWTENNSEFKDIEITLTNQEAINIENNETCNYSLEFDYLLFISNNTNINDIGNKLSALEKTITFKRFDELYLSLEIDSRSILSQFTDNDDSGYFVEGSITNIKNVMSSFLNTTINNDKFKSKWKSTKIDLSNSDISAINNTLLGFDIKNPFDGIVLKIDNIRIIEHCEDITIKTKVYNLNPSFNFNRLIDNKKSWELSENTRDYNKFHRDTKYEIIDDREIINSKELDLNISYNGTIETMFYEMIKENPLQITNIILTNPIFDEFDITSESLDTLSEFLAYFVGQFSNPRSYRTSHHNVIASFLTYKISNLSSITFENLTPIVNKIDTYWLDIISQFVPSTSIWESNIVLGNNGFNYDKFRYRKYSLVDVSMYRIGNVITVDSEFMGNTVNNVNKTLINYSLGSEFVGFIEYGELPRPNLILYFRNGLVGSNDSCGEILSPLSHAYVYNLIVGATMFEDEEASIVFIPTDTSLYYLLNYGGVEYSAKFDDNGIILELINLTNCIPNPILLRFDSRPHENSYSACSVDLGNLIDTYVHSFSIGQQIYDSLTMSNILQVSQPNMFYNIEYNGVRMSIRIDSNGRILEIVECSDTFTPEPPRAFNVNGGQFLLEGSIFGDDVSVTQYEIEYTSVTTGQTINIFRQKTGSNTPWIENSVASGTYNLKCRSLNSLGYSSTWLSVDNVLVTGVSEIVIREPEPTLEDPCVSFPPVRGIDRTAYIPVANLELISEQTRIYTDVNLTQTFTTSPSNTFNRVLIGDLIGSQMIHTNLNDLGTVMNFDPCATKPIQIEVGVAPAPISGSGCGEFIANDKFTAWNNNGFRIGSRFYTDETLTEQISLDAFEGQYLIGQIEYETSPRSMLIKNSEIAELAIPCAETSDTKFIRFNPNSINMSPNISCEIGNSGIDSFTHKLYFDGEFQRSTTLYTDSDLSEVYMLENPSSISFINEGSNVINSVRVDKGEVIDFYPCSRLSEINEILIDPITIPEFGNACDSATFNVTELAYVNEVSRGSQLYHDAYFTQEFNKTGIVSTIINRTKSVISIENGILIENKNC